MADGRAYAGAGIVVGTGERAARSSGTAVIVVCSEIPPAAAGVRSAGTAPIALTKGNLEAKVYGAAVIAICVEFTVPFTKRKAPLIVSPQTFPLMIGKAAR